MKNTISISKEQVDGTSQLISIGTNSFVILYLKDGKVKVDGDIELRDIAPMLMKYVAERMTK